MSKGEKKSVMLQAMLQKFQGDAARLLLETGNMELQERVSRGNGRPEDLWSIGPSGLGQNLCGECLMAVRQILRDAGNKRTRDINIHETDPTEKKQRPDPPSERPKPALRPCLETKYCTIKHKASPTDL